MSSNNQKTMTIDEAFHQHLMSLKNAKKTFSIEDQREALSLLLKDIENEKDTEIKHYMKDNLMYFLLETCIDLRYLYDNMWKSQFKEQRNTLKELYPISIYLLLEDILARQSDQTTYTKYHNARRYPLTVPENFGNLYDSMNLIPKDLSRLSLMNSHYRFGSHKYYVCQAINQILNCLEERYGLNFKELESNYQAHD